MKTVIALSFVGVCLVGCNSDRPKDNAVDQTRTTSAVIVDPTLHDSHTPESTAAPRATSDPGDQVYELDQMDQGDVHETSGPADEARDGG